MKQESMELYNVEHHDDVYHKQYANELVENDAISDGEAAFLQGYDESL